MLYVARITLIAREKNADGTYTVSLKNTEGKVVESTIARNSKDADLVQKLWEKDMAELMESRPGAEKERRQRDEKEVEKELKEADRVDYEGEKKEERIDIINYDKMSPEQLVEEIISAFKKEGRENIPTKADVMSKFEDPDFRKEIIAELRGLNADALAKKAPEKKAPVEEVPEKVSEKKAPVEEAPVVEAPG